MGKEITGSAFAFRGPTSALHPVADAFSPVRPTCRSAVTYFPASTAPLAGTYPATESLLPAVESPTPASEGPRDSVESFVPSVESFIPSVESFIPSVESFVPSVESFVPSVEGFSPSAEGLRESRSPTPLSPVSANPLTCLIERT